MVRILITGLFAVLWVIAQGQPCNLSVSGYVYDRNSEEALPFATVKVEDVQKGAITDENGYFEISGLCEEEIHLVVSMVGYKTIIHHHDVYHASPNIFLASDTKMLESIIVEEEIVSSEFLSLSAQSLSQKDMALMEKKSLGDLTANLSGVSTISTGQNVVKPVIHGLHSNRILIINNELRHEFQNWGIEHAPEIDANSIDQLEVVKGAAAVKYGPDALGGVILVKHGKPRLHDAFYGDMSHQVATNGRGLSSNLKVGWGAERWALQAQAGLQRFGDLQSPNYKLSNTGKKEYSYGVSALYHGTSLDVEAEVLSNYQQLGILRSSVTGNLNDLVSALSSEVPLFVDNFSYDVSPPYQEVTHWLARMKGTYRKADHFLTLQYGYQKNHRQEIDIRRGSTSLIPSINLELSTHTLDAEWRLPARGQWTMSVGSQSLIQDNNNIPGTNTVPFVPNFNNYRTGIFSVVSLNQTNYSLEAGVRYDYQYSSIRGRLPNNDIYRHALNYQNFTGSVGFVQYLNARNSLRINIGSAWRPPNISELYSFGKHQNALEYGLWRYRWNEDETLEAGQVLNENEQSLNAEIGTKIISTWNYQGEKIQAEIGGYANWIQNYLFTRPAGLTNTVRGAFPYFIFDQTTAFLTGLDADLTWKHSQSINSRFAASFLYARDLLNDTYFLNMPPFNVRHQLDWKMMDQPNMVTSLSIQNEWFARQWFALDVISPQAILDAYSASEDLITRDSAPFDISTVPDGYLLTNLSLNLDRSLFDYQIRVNNLFNSSYRIYTDRLRYFADQPGINLMIRISYQW